mmetsp:Transcript_78039/g.180982  ORF Transcript_78039/g.180982 Transcript_78039/m.180982 type:complete len:226 (+) Transcript_78039:208-885(+)
MTPLELGRVYSALQDEEYVVPIDGRAPFGSPAVGIPLSHSDARGAVNARSYDLACAGVVGARVDLRFASHQATIQDWNDCFVGGAMVRDRPLASPAVQAEPFVVLSELVLYAASESLPALRQRVVNAATPFGLRPCPPAVVSIELEVEELLRLCDYFSARLAATLTECLPEVLVREPIFILLRQRSLLVEPRVVLVWVWMGLLPCALLQPSDGHHHTFGFFVRVR